MSDPVVIVCANDKLPGRTITVYLPRGVTELPIERTRAGWYPVDTAAPKAAPKQPAEPANATQDKPGPRVSTPSKEQ